MSEISQQIICLVDMLPLDDQQLALRIVQKLVLECNAKYNRTVQSESFCADKSNIDTLQENSCDRL